MRLRFETLKLWTSNRTHRKLSDHLHLFHTENSFCKLLNFFIASLPKSLWFWFFSVSQFSFCQRFLCPSTARRPSSSAPSEFPKSPGRPVETFNLKVNWRNLESNATKLASIQATQLIRLFKCKLHSMPDVSRLPDSRVSRIKTLY